MPVPLTGQGPRAVIFDLDRVVIDSAGAWAYAVEEATASLTGRRVDAHPLVAGYRWRPWREALAVIIPDAEQVHRGAELCAEMFRRSAMKRLLVYDGIGMGLDRVRAARLEVGGITRLDHATARSQIESTGVDRFLTVLSATPPGEPWDPGARVAHCLAFLGCEPRRAAFVSNDAYDLERVGGAGLTPLPTLWGAPEESEPVMSGGLAHPSEVAAAVLAAWSARS